MRGDPCDIGCGEVTNSKRRKTEKALYCQEIGDNVILLEELAYVEFHNPMLV